MTGKHRFNMVLLNTIITNGNAILIGTYPKLTRDSKIDYYCDCGNLVEKRNFRQMEKSGSICWECSKKQAKAKSEATSMKKYNVSHPRKSDVVKQKQIETCLATYGETNPGKSQEVQEKMKQTTIKRYGVENAFQSKELMEKAIETNLKNYGVKNPAQSDIIQQRIKDTNIKKRGVEFPGQCPIIQEKARQTNLKRIGVENPFQASDFTEKSEATCLEKYGFRHSSQNDTIRQKTLKSGFRQKEFTMPSGKIVKVQGYEPFALAELLKTYKEEEIIVETEGSMPVIEYSTEDKKSHRYYPDIFIPHINMIIEVKSKYTVGKGGRYVELKKQATIQNGYLYEIWVYDGKGNKTLA